MIGKLLSKIFTRRNVDFVEMIAPPPIREVLEGGEAIVDVIKARKAKAKPRVAAKK
jgi:hypothetical protein